MNEPPLKSRWDLEPEKKDVWKHGGIISLSKMCSCHMEVALWVTLILVYSMKDFITNIAHNGAKIIERALKHGCVLVSRVSTLILLLHALVRRLLCLVSDCCKAHPDHIRNFSSVNHTKTHNDSNRVQVKSIFTPENPEAAEWLMIWVTDQKVRSSSPIIAQLALLGPWAKLLTVSAPAVCIMADPELWPERPNKPGSAEKRISLWRNASVPNESSFAQSKKVIPCCLNTTKTNTTSSLVSSNKPKTTLSALTWRTFSNH